MRLGARIVKTGIAVVLAYNVCAWFELDPPLLVVIAAVLTTQPSIYLSIRYFIDQVQANTIGALLSIVIVTALGNDPLIIGLTVMIVIIINLFLKLESSITLSILTVVAVMGQPDSAIDRFILVMIGIVLAIIVNAVFLPPNHEKQLLEKLRALHEHILFLLRNAAEEQFTGKSLGEEKEKVAEELKRAEELFHTFKEERTILKRNRLRKANKLVVYRTMLEVIRHELDMLKAIRREMDEPWVGAMKETVTTLAHYHESIFMKHEGKIKPKTPHERNEKVVAEVDALILRLQQEGQGTAPPPGLLVLAGQSKELAELLDHLDALVTVYASRYGAGGRGVRNGSTSS